MLYKLLTLNYLKQPIVYMRLFILIFLTMVSLVCSKMTIDFRSSTIGTSIFWVRAKIAIMGGRFPYIYQYTQLPNGWKQVNQYIYIPIEHLNSHKQYICHLTVQDQQHQQLEASITLIIQSGRVFIDSATYSYGEQFQVIPTQLKNDKGEGGVRIAEGKINNPARPKGQPSQKEGYKQNQKRQKDEKQSIGRIYNYQQEEKQNNNDPFSFFFSNIENSFSNQNQKSHEPKTIVLLVPEQKQEEQEDTGKHQDPQNNPQFLQKLKLTKNISDQQTVKKIQQVVKNSSKQIIVPNRSIDDIFRKLPTDKELDSIILSVDTLAISKTIQTVIVSKMDCDQKIAYLSQFFGRIQNNVEVKKLSLKKLKLIKELTLQQILRLQKQIQRLNSEHKQLGLARLNNKLHEQILKLEQAYDKYNEAVSQKSLASKRLPTYEKTMKNLKSSISIQKKAMPKELEELQITSKEIQQIEQRLRIKKQKQGKLVRSIQSRKKKIKTMQKSLQLAIEQAKKTSQIIINGPQNLDLLKRNYLLFQVQVGRIREDIHSGTKKQNKILSNIQRVEEQIEKEQQRINQREINAIEKTIQHLERNLPNIQQQIDRLYYSCYQASQIVQYSVDPVNSPSYLIQPIKFVQYLQRAYGLNNVKNVSLMKQQEILTKSSIFSSAWGQNYGSAFNVIEKVQESLIKNDFNCLRPSKLETRAGTIKYIRNNMMIVSGDDGNIYKLFLGSCSRMQSAGSEVPEIGQRIIFKGNQDIEQQFKVYSASSY